jgi:hypothetical protein
MGSRGSRKLLAFQCHLVLEARSPAAQVQLLVQLLGYHLPGHAVSQENKSSSQITQVSIVVHSMLIQFSNPSSNVAWTKHTVILLHRRSVSVARRCAHPATP